MQEFFNFVLETIQANGGKVYLTALAAAYGQPVRFEWLQAAKQRGILEYNAVIVDGKPNVEIRA